MISGSDPQLISKVVMDYTRLQHLLESGNWKEADLETSAVMLQVAGREQEGWFNTESIVNFPCSDLKLIDQLWMQSSEFRFGFSVQKQIYEKAKGDFLEFGDRVGWREKNEWLNYGDLIFDLSAPVGHLPSGGIGYKRWTRWVTVSYATLMQRLETCQSAANCED